MRTSRMRYWTGADAGMHKGWDEMSAAEYVEMALGNASIVARATGEQFIAPSSRDYDSANDAVSAYYHVSGGTLSYAHTDPAAVIAAHAAVARRGSRSGR